MLVLWMLAALVFVSGEVCAVWCGAVYSGLMVRVNQQLPVDQRFRWYETKSARHWAAARERYPREARRVRILRRAFFGCFAAALGLARWAAYLQYHH